MKTKLLLLAMTCLLLLAETGHVQSLTIDHRRLDNQWTRSNIRATWNGSLISVVNGIATVPEFREGWNISDEQFQQIEALLRPGGVRPAYTTFPEYREIEEEHRRKQIYLFEQGASEQTRMDAYLEYSEKRSAIRNEFINNSLDDILTEEQIQMMREYQLADMSNQPFLFLATGFEALGLTEEQRQMIETIKKEFEPEFEKMLDDYLSDRNREMWRVHQNFAAQIGDNHYQRVHNRLMAENPAYRRHHEEIAAHRERFESQFMVKVFDVLDDNQWNRLQDLIDNPPEYLAAFRNRLAEEAAARGQMWQPGPDSWRPGMPVPESYRQQRNERRFPRPQ